MSALPDIDKIDDISEMVTTMASLKISTKGLKSLDEMKAKVKETLQSSERKSSWTAKEVRTLQYLFKYGLPANSIHKQHFQYNGGSIWV